MKLIPLTQGKVSEVSDHWYDFINQWKWYFSTKGYAVRNSSRKDHPEGKQTQIYMHLLIHPSPKGFETDHEDRDKLNNQDYNLRTVTPIQNKINRASFENSKSKYKGVSWHIRLKKWIAQIWFNKIKYHLGYFKDEIEAAKAYDKAALQYHGEFAVLNFP